MPAPARAAAFRALVAVARGRLDLGEAAARGHAGLEDPRDRALLSELLTGTLRWQGRLDFQLARLSG
ncbi:MAG: transcription antitermination factor NusB, partial [Vicinamibacteria bacterium]